MARATTKPANTSRFNSPFSPLIVGESGLVREKVGECVSECVRECVCVYVRERKSV